MADETTTTVPAVKPWLSKTVWFNAVVGLAGVAGLFHPPVQAWVAGHSESLLIGVGVIGTLIRLVTKGRISLAD